MSLTNDQITAKNFKDFYNQIRPYLNGEAHAGFTPVGTVISVMGKTAPQNYLICDGTAYNIADYPELAAYFLEQFESVNFFGGNGTTTFAVPDLRGEFLRGTGTNSHANQGSGATVGTHQDGSAIPKTEAYKNSNFLTYEDNDPVGPLNLEGTSPRQHTNFTAHARANNGSVSGDLYGFVRPTNTSVLYCIAVKNIFNDASEGQADVMPIASVNYKDRIVQYVGATNATYTNGFFYKCMEDSSTSPVTYSWEEVNTQGNPEALSSSDIDDIKAAFDGMNKGAPLRMMNYSTDEQVVGTWIDGKPLYQKTLVSNTAINTNAAATLFSGELTNIDYIQKVCPVMFVTADASYACEYCLNNQNVMLAFLTVKSNSASLYCDIKAQNVTKTIMTVQYTKTTD